MTQHYYIFPLSGLVSGTTYPITPQPAEGGKPIGIASIHCFGSGASSVTSAFTCSLLIRTNPKQDGSGTYVDLLTLQNAVGEPVEFTPGADVTLNSPWGFVKPTFSNGGDGLTGAVVFSYLP